MVLATAGVLQATLQFSQRNEFNRLTDLSTRQLDLYVAALDGELQRYAYLASLMEVDSDITKALAAGRHNTLLERKLQNLAVRAGVQELMVLSRSGNIVASSQTEWAFTLHERVGSKDQLLNQPSQWFMPNPQSNAPEYFFSHPIFDIAGKGDWLGTAIVKISLAPLESAWVDLAFRPESEKVLVVDPQGRIILSSAPQWKDRNFHNEPALQGQYLIHERLHPQTGWRMLILNNPHGVDQAIRITMVSTIAGLAFLHLLYFYFLLRRKALHRLMEARNALQKAHDELERKVVERTHDLHRSNQQLQHEMQERQHAQAALLHRNKMAVLGQMSAKVAHEISQPLTALRALSNNSKILLDKQRFTEVADNLRAFTDIVGRMIHMTVELKTFSRKSRPQEHAARTVDLHATITNSCKVLAERIDKESITLNIADDLPTVVADSVQLEQVFTNLLSNAMDAMENLPPNHTRHISIGWGLATHNPQRVNVWVQDTGVGIAQELAEHLFEPFYTNKPNGKGLGLGLSISANIITEHGGTLRLDPETAVDATGAIFIFDLQRA
jgi:C4-dicarboxylate-specific signal transduction histidine kinase